MRTSAWWRFLRRSKEGELLVFAVNATPVVRYNYRLGVTQDGFYREIINTDGETYGGSNVGNLGGLEAEAVEWQGRTHSIVINLPPLAVVAFKREAGPAGDSAVETPNEAKATS
jgi:1,4-alpha-glucan branching enzyme